MTQLNIKDSGISPVQTFEQVAGLSNRASLGSQRTRRKARLDENAQASGESPDGDQLASQVERNNDPIRILVDPLGERLLTETNSEVEPLQLAQSGTLGNRQADFLAQAPSSVLSDLPARSVEAQGASVKEFNVSTGTLVVAGAALVGLAAATGGGGSSGPRNQAGVVQDGLVKDATVFIDVNKNGVLDTGEPSAKTDAKGTFTIASDASGPIVATGGVNIDTGSANTIILKAQPGSTVINPITTVVNALVVEQSLTQAAAETAVKSALGLDAKINLSTYDPFAGTGDVAYQKVAASVALLASTVAAAVPGGGGAAFSALATTIKQTSAALDLTKAATLTTVFASVPAIATQSADLAQKNAAIATASSISDIPQKLLDYGVSQLALSLKVDSGISNDRITNDGSVVLKDSTGAVVNPSGLQYSIDGGKSFKAGLTTFAAAEGSNSVVLRLVADNGLASKSSTPLTFTLDTVAPSVPAVGIAPGSVGVVVNDSGLSSTDGITNVANPVLAGSAEAGAAIEIVVAGSTLKTTADSAGRWTATLPSATRLADGTPDVTVAITDVAGNVKTSTAKASFTIDTKVPAAGTGGLTATAINDTGTSSTDGITANNRPQLSGTAEAGSNVTIDVGVGTPYITTASGTGSWSIDVRAGSELKDGVVTPKITVADVAGNTVTSNGLTFTVDTAAPATPSLSLKTDSGLSATDRITNIAASAADFNVGSVESGARVEFSLGGGAWSQTIKPSEGANSVQVRAVDVAGNISVATPALTFTLDTVAPVVTGVTGGLIHDEINDTGVDQTDGVTANLSPSLSGKAPAGSYLQVEFGPTTVFKLPSAVGAEGKWTLPVELSYGDWAPTIRILDAAGNSATVAGEKFVIQSEGPYKGPVTVELAHTAVSDTGSSLTDNLTNNSTPFLSGIAAPRSTVTVLVGDASYPVTTDRKGNYTVKITGNLADGEYTPSIIVPDVDGNPKVPVGGTSFVVDTVITSDGLVAGLVHDSVNDTGGDPTDNRTGNASPTLEGVAEPGSKLTISFAGSTKTFSLTQPVGDDGAWQQPVTLSNGTWTPLIKVTDVAGNTLTIPFEGETFTIDTVAPTATGSLAAGSDTGISDSDGFTSNPIPTLTGKTEPGAMLSVTVGAQTLDALVDPDTGDWSVDLTDNLPDGAYTPLFTATDEFGNASAPIKGTAFTIDTIAPVFRGQLDQTYKVGEAVTLTLPAAFKGEGVLAYSAEDLTGNLGGMGLMLVAETGAISGKVTAPSARDPSLYDSWVKVTIEDLAGNQSIDEFQVSIVDVVKPAASTYTLNTDYFASTTSNPQVFKYPGTESAQTVTLTQSYRDVIELAGGNDIVNLTGNEFGVNSAGDSGRMNFARLDGGDAQVAVTSTVAGDTLAFKFEGDVDFNLGNFNRPGDGQGQVLVNFETIDASLAKANVNLTVTPLDLFLQGSDFFDANTGTGGDKVSRSTLVFRGTATDSLTLPPVDLETNPNDKDFVTVGTPGGWDVSGTKLTTASLTAGYTKLQGEVFSEGSVHYVELLVSATVPIA